MTTVAFVTYKVGVTDRRVGPLSIEQAEAMAKDVARRDSISAVRLEEWTCTRVTPIGE